MSNLNLNVPLEALSEFCPANSICRLSLFGSILRDDFQPDNDIDVLVEFESGSVITYLDKSRIRRELTELFGREVDLRTEAELSPYIRERVLAIAEVQYVR